MTIRPLFALALVCVAPLASLAACTSLTSPPEPADITVESPAIAVSSLTPDQIRKPKNPALPENTADQPGAPPAADTAKVDIAEVAPGKGTPAKNGDVVFVNYVGKMPDGKIFDQSKGKPFSFKLGASQVIKGWDQGLLGMKPGQKRKLTIPPSLAYGARGFPPAIPPNSTLVFDVELVDIKPGQ